MQIIEFLKQLATNPKHKIADIDSLLSQQAEIIQQAFKHQDSDLLRDYLSQHQKMADKTTIFQF